MRIKDGERVIGQTIQFTIIKNKVGEPFGVAESNFYFGKGFNKSEELVDFAIHLGLVNQGGAWFTLPHENEDGSSVRIQGRKGCYDYYSENPDKLAELQTMINMSGNMFDKADLSEEDKDDGDEKDE